MNVKIYIENELADYSAIEDLDFVMTAQIRDFETLANVRGFELDNTVNSLILPATKRNKNLLLGSKNTKMSFKALVNNVQRFSGQCMFLEEVYTNDTLTHISLEVFGGNSDFVSQINDVSLRDLDLGEVDWTPTAIENSWAGDADNDAGIFAPVVYGKLLTNTADNWSFEDFRYHVYYKTIVDGIADYLKITIESNFFELDFFKKQVYLFGVGKDWKSTTRDLYNTAVTTATTTKTLNITTKGNYIAVIEMPASGTYAPDHIEIRASNGFVSVDLVYTAGTDYVYNLTIGELDNGDTIVLEGHNAGHGLVNLPVGTQFRAYGDYTMLPNKTLKVETALHNRPIVDFLAALIEKFNLVFFYNPIIRLLKIEPMFDYQIGSTIYSGFYSKPNDAHYEMKQDLSSYNISSKALFEKIDFSFQENKTCDDYLKGRIDTNLDLLGVRVDISEGTDIKKFGNKYFKRVYNGKVEGVNSDYDLPILLDEDFKILDSGNTIEDPTFIFEPAFAFVTSKTADITFEGASKTVPVLSQMNIGTTDEYSLSWSDVIVNEGGTDVTKAGLATIFYRKQIAILKRYEVLKTSILLKSFNNIEIFNTLYKNSRGFWILSKLSNIKLDDEKVSAEFVRYISEQSTDIASLTQNSVVSNTMIVDVL